MGEKACGTPRDAFILSIQNPAHSGVGKLELTAGSQPRSLLSIAILNSAISRTASDER